MSRGGSAEPVTAALLRDWPLPNADASGDKRARGLVVCVGGSLALPGAMILAGTAALRAGAGTVRLGLPRSIAVAVGVSIPEALVFGVATTRAGAIAAEAAAEVAARAAEADVVLVGPGMVGSKSTPRFLDLLLPRLRHARAVILDARALDGAAQVAEAVRECSPRAIVTPHAGEMARMLGIRREDVEEHPLEAARRAAQTFQAVVALKGARTLVVAPEGDTYCYQEGSIGLAMSGSGDALAGIIAGLAARGADATQAAVWGVYLHGTAGNRLGERVGRLGFLARELVDEVPAILADLPGRDVGSIRVPDQMRSGAE